MRVSHPGNNPVPGNETAGARQGGRAAPSHEAKRSEHGPAADVEKSAHGSANTEISTKSKEFAQAKAVASDTPDVREDKIADLKRRIAEGSYNVDHEAVADRLVDDHLRMSGIG